MDTKQKLISAIILGTLLMAGCAPATRAPATPVDYPECDPAHMTAPVLISIPDNAVMNSFIPHFEWEYPGYTMVDGTKQPCNTAGFIVHLSTGPSFQDELGNKNPHGAPASNGTYSGTWTTNTPLEPGRWYHWNITPFSQGQNGPVSETRTFFTGPSCEPYTLVSPLPLSPINHWIVNTTQPKFSWWYPQACRPDYYLINISPNMQFENSIYNGTTASSETSWSGVAPLTDCSRYFWQVVPGLNGQTGPASQVYTFRVDLTGSCPVETLGMIQGTIWEDQCAGPGPGTPVPNQPPLGCVLTPQNSLFPNQTYDPGEPGIEGVIVRLAQGACPSATILRDVPTWSDGMYDFFIVGPGTYCVMVDSTSSFNSPVLQPGNWTAPEDAVNQTIARRTITLAAGQDLKGTDFGWWYKYGVGWGSTNATVFGQVWNDLCAYVPGDPVPDPLPTGCVMNQYGNVSADAIHQPDEPGIAGVTVDIGPGDCPSAGLATSLTDANGWYTFTDLAPGKYCVRIDPDHGSPNEAVLLPGQWTYIPSGHEGMTFRPITLTANHTLPGVDFGWDYENLPQPVAPSFTLESNANCRRGPLILYEALEIGYSGETYPIVGRNDDGTWYLVQFKQSLQCWFAGSMGKQSGDISRVPFKTPPPLPTPTLVPVVCSAFTTPVTCRANPACTWVVGIVPGYCKAK